MSNLQSSGKPAGSPIGTVMNVNINWTLTDLVGDLTYTFKIVSRKLIRDCMNFSCSATNISKSFSVASLYLNEMSAAVQLIAINVSNKNHSMLVGHCCYITISHRRIFVHCYIPILNLSSKSTICLLSACAHYTKTTTNLEITERHSWKERWCLPSFVIQQICYYLYTKQVVTCK